MLELDASTRAGLWRELVAAIETATEADELPVFTERDADEVRAFVERFDFDAPLEPVEALRLAVDGLSRYAVNFRSPRYFGLFDPAPAAMGVVAEALAAAFNPQLAAWLASPFAIEAESHLIRVVGTRFGLPADGVDGTFHVSTSYVPASGKLVDPFTHSLQWSRRFIGLKVLLALAVAGWDGYEDVVRHQLAIGELLRARLRETGWQVVNETPLPLVCFADTAGADPDAIVDAVNATRRARIFAATIPPDRRVIRAAITNFRTGPEDLDALVHALDDARSTV